MYKRQISQSAEIDEEKAQTEEFKNPEIGNNPKAENQETKDTIIKMETNIDDCSGEVLGFVMEQMCIRDRMMGYYAIYALTAAANGQELEDVPTDGYWYDSTNMDSEEIAPNLYD